MSEEGDAIKARTQELKTGERTIKPGTVGTRRNSGGNSAGSTSGDASGDTSDSTNGVGRETNGTPRTNGGVGAVDGTGTGGGTNAGNDGKREPAGPSQQNGPNEQPTVATNGHDNRSDATGGRGNVGGWGNYTPDNTGTGEETRNVRLDSDTGAGLGEQPKRRGRGKAQPAPEPLRIAYTPVRIDAATMARGVSFIFTGVAMMLTPNWQHTPEECMPLGEDLSEIVGGLNPEIVEKLAKGMPWISLITGIGILCRRSMDLDARDRYNAWLATQNPTANVGIPNPNNIGTAANVEHGGGFSGNNGTNAGTIQIVGGGVTNYPDSLR